jgi:hypothetical protein
MLKNTKPYISILFANRNDNYGGDQHERIELFIKFYSMVVKNYPDLFEFLICDWNTPQGNQSLEEAYDWSTLGNVRHFKISKEIHEKLCPDNSRPILDYWSRNFLARRASGQFFMIINQDIFLSSSIIKFLSEKKLSQNHFYRCDRTDFKNFGTNFSSTFDFEIKARNNAMAKHLRPPDIMLSCSIKVDKESLDHIGTRAHPKLERVDQNDKLIIGRKVHFLKAIDIIRSKLSLVFGRKILPPIDQSFYKKYLLHTNASGDFIIISRKAFFKVRGFPESYQFYMHTDSYMCAQLFAAGFTQVIFDYPHEVYHNDHSRLDREARPESMSYKDHAVIFAKMILGKKSYKINSRNWGLKDLS